MYVYIEITSLWEFFWNAKQSPIALKQRPFKPANIFFLHYSVNSLNQ